MFAENQLAHMCSAAGLKCNQPGIAEESAEWALKFDPTDAKAGKRLQKARCMLSRNRTSAGVKNAERDELPREDLTQPCESASEQIRAADCALNVSKADHPAQCSRIEALIRCHRFRDAIHEAGKFDGVDACYLKAEAHLRSGQPGQAADEVKRQMGVSQKCARLFGDARAAADSLSKAKHLIASASHPDRVCEALACILDASNHCRLGAAGLRCEALTMKADSMLSTRVADEALEEAENALNEAISLDQGSVYALQQRARLFGCKGEHEEAVMDLRQALLHCNERHILRDLRRHARKAQAFHALGTDQTKNEDEQGLNVRANGLANLGESPDGVIRLSDIRWPQGFNLIEDMAGGPGASWEDKKHAARELRRCALQNANPQSISSFYSDLLFLLMAAWHPDRWQGKNLSVQQRERILQGVKEVFQRIELERDRLGLD